MNEMRFTNTLEVSAGPKGHQFRCAACKHLVCGDGRNWKHGASLTERSARELRGPYSTGRDLILRQFSCPGCGALLDTEMALPGDPWLEDRLLDASH
jgi:acetone carboxylase gamma subunit